MPVVTSALSCDLYTVSGERVTSPGLTVLRDSRLRGLQWWCGAKWKSRERSLKVRRCAACGRDACRAQWPVP